MADSQIAKQNRPQVIIMLIALPLISAFAVCSLIFLAQRDALFQTTNRGEFVDPPVLARHLELKDALDAPVDGSGRWWLWLVRMECDPACEATLAGLQRLHGQLASDADRVRWALISPDASGFRRLGDRFPELPRFVAKGERRLEEGAYIVDPLGSVLLRYSADTKPGPVQEDLARLLKASSF